MPAVIFTMLVILGIAAVVIAVVVMGMEGTGRAKHPELADAMARTARHLNGEGEPPRGLRELFDEAGDVRTAASTRSASSAGSAPTVSPVEPDEPEAATVPQHEVRAWLEDAPGDDDPFGLAGAPAIGPGQRAD